MEPTPTALKKWRKRGPSTATSDILAERSEKRGLLYHATSVAPYNDREYIWKCLDEAKLEFQATHGGVISMGEWYRKWLGE